MDRTTGSPSWSVIAHDAGLLKEAVDELDVGQQGQDPQDAAYELLLTVTVVGSRLATLLDALASRYENPGVPEQHAAHLALDQAAAAAEDLGASARQAARTLHDEP